ncbi:MAG TPA: hypothetical protein VNW25_01960 [Candidatus Sulfotelmatobacter sp.]|nr:hypothetical protein [Candidatus Sulfotelmatobacter sp.]
MHSSWIKIIGLKSDPIKFVLVVLGWGVSLASLALTGIVSGVIIPRAAAKPNMPISGIALYYAAIFGVSLLAGLVLSNIARSLIGSLASNSFAAALTYLALIIPGLTGIIPETIAEDLAITFTFTAFFPFAMFLGLIGGLLGSMFTEI